MMWETILIWMVPSAITIHNVEEALWLPAWSKSAARRWHPPVSVFAFRFAVVILTAVAITVAIFAQLGGHGTLGFYLLAAYAIGQSLNIFVPHLAAVIATRTYAPGLATGLFLVLPASGAFLMNALSSPNFDLRRLLVVSVVFIPVMVLSIPGLLGAGEMIEKRRKAEAANKPDAGDGI